MYPLDEIRKYITDARMLALLSKPASWNKLTSSLDTIDDNGKAIEAFLGIDLPDAAGSNYLLIYGVLQALVVQQDAVKHLYDSLNYDYDRHPSLWKIRGTRDAAIGHPTERDKGNKDSDKKESNSMAPFNKNVFQLMTTYPDGRPPSFQNVNIPEIIAKQRTIVEQDVLEIIKKLKQGEREHREMFKEQKLKNIFQGTSYNIQKIYESIRANRPNKFGEGHVDMVIKVIADFRKSLEDRGILKNYNSINDLDYPLNELKIYFQNPDQSKLNEEDAIIFTFFIEHNLKIQRQNAIEIDEKYEAAV